MRLHHLLGAVLLLQISPTLATVLLGCTTTPREFIGSKAFMVRAKTSDSLDLFLSKSMEYSPLNAFMDVYLITNLTDQETFTIYQGENCSVVLDEYNNDNRLFGLLKSVNAWRSHRLYPFNQTVIGIDTRLPYTIHTKVWNVNVIRACVFVGGVVLFLFANSLVRNTLFYYTSGCSFGVFASLLLVAFIVYRFAPKKTIGIPMLLGGWSVSLYMLHFAWNNFAYIIMQYQKYVAAYFISVLLISFAVCYKKGPPTDARSHDIAQWTLQLLALVLIYASSQIPEVSLAVVGVLVLHQLTKSWLWSTLACIGRMAKWAWRTVFPQKVRLLTEEEYERQKDATTREELDKLRSFCKSPQADSWKIARTVKNPQRLARFVDGSEGHISDDEEQLHMDEAETMEERDEDDVMENEIDLDDLDDDDEWEHELIIRRTPRNGGPSRASSSAGRSIQSIRLPRDVTARLLGGTRLPGVQSASRAPAPSSSVSQRNAVRPPRHSLAAVSGAAQLRRENSRSTPRVSTSRSTSSADGGIARRTHNRHAVQPRSNHSRSSNADAFMSSDSEDSGNEQNN